jgi:hypothetical protein
VKHDSLFDFFPGDLDRLNLAAGVILSEPTVIPPLLAAELVTFKKRVERALLRPDDGDDTYTPGERGSMSEWPSVLGTGVGTPLVLINSDRFTRPDPKEAAEVAAAIAVLRGYGMLVNDGYTAR